MSCTPRFISPSLAHPGSAHAKSEQIQHLELEVQTGKDALNEMVERVSTKFEPFWVTSLID